MDREAIYREFYPKVMGYVGARLSGRAETEDVTSEVFVKVYASLERYDERRASLSTWIYTITKNTLSNHFAKQKNAPLPLEDYAEGMKTQDMDDELETLAEAIDELDSKERDIVILHYYYGLSHKEIAEKMGISYANARKRCSLAVAELRQKIT